jgi:tRNA A-37 threonylcarbamoyl transferase component Bud32
MAHPIAPSTMKEIPAGLPATLRPLGALPAEEAQDRFWNLVALMVTCLIAVGVGGLWSYSKVRESLQDIRAAGLASLLESEVSGMLMWIDEKKRDAERWALVEDVRDRALQLVATLPHVACRSDTSRALRSRLAPFLAIEEGVAFNVMRPDGTVVAASHEAYCGARVVSEEHRERMEPALEGRTIFVRPWRESERVGAPVAGLDEPLVWVYTPLTGDDGRVLAVLGFARRAADRFGQLLSLSSAQTTREAYAFDRDGRLLTQPRFVGDLRQGGQLGPADTGILTLQARDTRLLAEAIHTRPSDVTGAVLEPYANYRGAEVIGAWRWLPEKEMAVAVEIEASEAFAPLWYVQIAFGGLFLLLLVSLGAAGATSIWAVRMRMREARRIGPYTIEREIGEGGMSRVYLARHALLRRPTALKVLRPAIASDEVTTRFEREVQLCSQLTHPNTIDIYDYGRTRDGTFYYAMEYLEGISFEELVRREGRQPIGRVIHALRQVCGSLQEAHDRGLVHRDVKPHNLMLCVRGGRPDVVKVLDFGLVKEMHNPHTRDITQFAKVLGTPLYMPPERLRNPADADARCDVYGLGAVAYLLLTGRPVFEAGTDHDLVYKIMNEPAPTLAEGGLADAPAALESLLARCLAKDRDQRPASAAAVERELTELARDFPWSITP